MPNLPTKIVLFLSSYMPLFLIMAVKYGGAHHVFGGIMLLVAFASVALLLYFLSSARALGNDIVTVENISAKDTEAMSYIVTYLIPFLDIKIDEPANLISLLLLFVVLGVIYVHSNLIYINPTLNVLKYHLFEIELEGGKTSALLSKRSFIERGSAVAVISLGDQILLEAPDAR
jgi:hypothetical protein